MSAIVVTRYFGGIKLGAGGLVGAYSGAAADVLKSAKVLVKKECKIVRLNADYSTFSAVEKYLLKADCKPVNYDYGDDVSCEIVVPIDDVDKFVLDINELTSGKAQTIVCDEVFFDSTDK